MKKGERFNVFLLLLIALLLISLFFQGEKKRPNAEKRPVLNQVANKKQVLKQLGPEYYSIIDDKTGVCHFSKDLTSNLDSDGSTRYSASCGQKIDGAAYRNSVADRIQDKIKSFCPDCLGELEKDQSSKKNRR